MPGMPDAARRGQTFQMPGLNVVIYGSWIGDVRPCCGRGDGKIQSRPKPEPNQLEFERCTDAFGCINARGSALL
eukprot:6773739-Prymnesium_polylepis.1